MFDHLDLLPADPILGLSQVFAKDNCTDKVNLSVGVYQDDNGNTPVLDIVRRAQQIMLDEQTSKAYIAQAGDAGFLSGMSELVLGPIAALLATDNRVATVQTPGGCGAVRIASEVLNKCNPGGKVWISTPTWANHQPLVTSAGLTIAEYPYYDRNTKTILFDDMMAALRQASRGDVILLHACCHNPTGADLSPSQWDSLADLCKENGLLPFIDFAYQGFGQGLQDDAYGVRKMAQKVEELVIAASCSKNFGLYRERVGAMIFIGSTGTATAAAKSHALSEARRSYTMAPYHGAGIVGYILNNAELRTDWETELANMRGRINGMRKRLCIGLNQAQSSTDFSFIGNQWGMFSFLGITVEQVLELRSKYGIYILESSRINVAGISDSNIDYVVEKIAQTVS
ncbi:MAG TPA: aromatic amino acid aminotransferase [Gammaproteobacteria bacterium]|nr:aromatic amino acid aminotransferase [Gammaproteobacteria bacterium]